MSLFSITRYAGIARCQTCRRMQPKSVPPPFVPTFIVVDESGEAQECATCAEFSAARAMRMSALAGNSAVK